MNPSQLLERFAVDVASVIPDIDAEVSHGRYGDGIGGFEEPRQIELIAERLDTTDTDYDAIETEVPYPFTDQWCDIVLDTTTGCLPIEAKLLRFNRANGDIEPSAYGSVFSPLSNSLVTDARKLANGRFGLPAGLLGIYYERGDEDSPAFDARTLTDKVRQDVKYWFGHSVGRGVVVEFDGLRHPVHQQGAVVTWELTG